VLLVIVATGNHFLLDAATGAAVAGVALCIALGLSRASRSASVSLRSVTAVEEPGDEYEIAA